MTWKDGEYEAKQQRADEKKQRILDSAIKLFGEKGFHNTTAKHIAADAGIAIGSFYRYFKDKKAVLMAVCRRKEDDMSTQIFGIAQQMRLDGLSEKEIITKIITKAVQSHSENIGFHKEIQALQLLDEDVRAWVADRERRVYDSIFQLLATSPEPLKITDKSGAAELISYTVEEITHRVLYGTLITNDKDLTEALCLMITRYLYD